mmetsp:Transcript_43877/g.72478  ORF Transcript_43877/g.72478 Transcript_43877/m.72478 type:complete len:191 (+) Transcript_43877:68-640(+)
MMLSFILLCIAVLGVSVRKCAFLHSHEDAANFARDVIHPQVLAFFNDLGSMNKQHWVWSTFSNETKFCVQGSTCDVGRDAIFQRWSPIIGSTNRSDLQVGVESYSGNGVLMKCIAHHAMFDDATCLGMFHILVYIKDDGSITEEHIFGDNAFMDCCRRSWDEFLQSQLEINTQYTYESTFEDYIDDIWWC